MAWLSWSREGSLVAITALPHGSLLLYLDMGPESLAVSFLELSLHSHVTTVTSNSWPQALLTSVHWGALKALCFYGSGLLLGGGVGVSVPYGGHTAWVTLGHNPGSRALQSLLKP